MAVETGTFDRPVGIAPSDEELEKFIPEAQEQAWRARQYAETKWLIASAVLEGHHYYNVDWNNRSVTFNPHDPKGSVRVRIPELLSRFRREKGRMLSVLRPPSTKPLVTGKPDIWRLNRFGTGALAYIYQNTEFAEVASTFLSDLLMEGTAGLLTFWDENFLPDDQTAGEVNFRPIPAWQLYPFPATAIDDQSLDGIIWSRVVGAEWIKRNIPEAIVEETVQVSTPYHTVKSASASPVSFSGYQVRYVFFKPSRRFPQGEQLIMVGKKIYRRVGSLNFWIGKRRVLPISIARYTRTNTSWWGESFGYSIAQLNKEMNRMMSLLVRRAIVKAHPGYLLYPLGAFAAEDFKNQVGGMIPFKPSAVNPDMYKPQWLVPPSGPAETDVMVNRFNLFSQEIASQHGPSEGQTVGRVDSHAALQGLIQQDMVPIEDAFRSIDNCFKRSFSIALEIARSRWSAPRIASVSGPMGGVRTTIEIDPQRIPSLDEITVVTGLDMPMDRPSQLQFLSALAAPRFKGDVPILAPEEYRRGLISLGVALPGVDLISPDEEAAWIENMTLYGDGQTPGQVNEPDSSLENCEIHARVHKRFSASPEVQTASPAVRAAFSQHIQLTGAALQGNPVPLEFDSDYKLAQAADLSDQVESAQSILGSMGGFQ